MSPAEQGRLLIPYGLLRGKLVTPTEAPRGLSGAVCIECSGNLIAAKGDTIPPYFRHEPSNERICDYSSESVRHWLAKTALAERLEQAIAKGSEIPIQWSCNCPRRRHTGNLARIATRISVDDEQVGPYLPDIGIFDQEDRCRVFVEIEFTHSNSPEKIAYCKAEDISMVTVDIRLVTDPVAFVRRTPLSVGNTTCLYLAGTTCHCGKKKLAKSNECVGCSRLNNGIDIDIAGSYRYIPSRSGAWAAILTDANGEEFQYSGQDFGKQGSQLQMLRSALVELEQSWQGGYPVRIHSKEHLLGSLEGKKLFAGRATEIRYWYSTKDNGGTGEFQPDRVGRLVSNRPKLARAGQIARELFEKGTAPSA